MTENGRARPKAMCVFRNAGRILVYPILDSVTGETKWRPFGGCLEEGESPEDGLRREMREELGQEIDEPVLLGELDNRFEWDGACQHEICFVFDARLRDASLYALEQVKGVEPNGNVLVARWLRLDSFDSDASLVPEGLLSLLRR